MSRYCVRRAHLSRYPHPIEFCAGERLTLGRRDDEYPGWVWTRTANGNAGWAPLALMRVAEDGRYALAQQDYCARELNTAIGDLLDVQRELNDWSWVMRPDGETGWVPSATLERLAGE